MLFYESAKFDCSRELIALDSLMPEEFGVSTGFIKSDRGASDIS